MYHVNHSICMSLYSRILPQSNITFDCSTCSTQRVKKERSQNGGARILTQKHTSVGDQVRCKCIILNAQVHHHSPIIRSVGLRLPLLSADLAFSRRRRRRHWVDGWKEARRGSHPLKWQHTSCSGKRGRARKGKLFCFSISKTKAQTTRFGDGFSLGNWMKTLRRMVIYAIFTLNFYERNGMADGRRVIYIPKGCYFRLNAKCSFFCLF